MFIKQGEHVQAARLFSFLTLGEELAHFCAKEQAGRVENQNMRRFFQNSDTSRTLSSNNFSTRRIDIDTQRLQL